jgi:Predicted integral membrane protein
MVVVMMAAALVAVFAAAIPAWLSDHDSIIRLLHYWIAVVQGDDSWKPMREAYAWHTGGHSETIYRHVFFDQHTKFQYPPASLLIFALPDALHMPVSDRALNWVGWFSVLIVAGATGALTWRATRDWPETNLRYAAAALAALLAMTFYPILWAFRQGQIQTWLSAWFALSALAFFTGRMKTAGALIGAICFAKPHFMVFLLWAVLRRQWNFAGAMAAVLAVTFVTSMAVFGWADHVDYLAALSYMSHHGEAFVRNYSVNGVMHRLIGNGFNLDFQPHDYAPYHPLVYWTTVASSVVFIGLALFYRRKQTPNLFDFFIAALSLTISSPIAWEHHYGILPPIFAMLALTLARSGRRNLVAAAALFLAFVACDTILPPIAALSTGLGSLLQATVFFGALAVLVLLYRFRDAFPLALKPHEHAPAVEQVAEQPAHQGVGKGA